jgi:hypothetical protein
MNLQSIASGRTAYPLTTVQYYPDLIRSIQTALNRMGYSAGAITGSWTQDTNNAFASFAKRYRFENNQISPRAAKVLLDALPTTTTPSPSPQPSPTITPQPTPRPSPSPSPQPSSAATASSSLTLQAIASGSVAYSITSIQNYSSIVQPIQTALNRLGFSAGTVDGRWGTATHSAYRAFALRYGFNPNEISPRAASFILTSVGSVTPQPSPTPTPRPTPTPTPTPPSPSPTPTPSGNYFDEALRFTLRWEGGYSNNPNDYGGATNKGVIQSVYDEYRRSKGLPTRAVLYITDAEVLDIYRNRYWSPSQASLMTRALAIAHFDTAVNFGVSGSVMFLQETLGLAADGVFGPMTRSALERSNTSSTARRYVQGRINYRYTRVSQDPSQRVFLQGWLNRDNDLMRYISNIP